MEDPIFGSQPHATSLLALIGPIGSGIMYCLCASFIPSQLLPVLPFILAYPLILAYPFLLTLPT